MVQRSDGFGWSQEIVTVEEAMRNAASGRWDVPLFQRRFVWKSQQACDLADSLWRDYPIGSLLLWRQPPDETGHERYLIADGQHRLATSCALFGREPLWWREQRLPPSKPAMRQPDLRFDVAARKPPFFVDLSANGHGGARYVPLARLFAFEESRLRGELWSIARRLRADGCCAGTEIEEICARLLSVRKIGQRRITAFVLDCATEEDVKEVFKRLTGGGIRFKRLALNLLLARLPRLKPRY